MRITPVIACLIILSPEAASGHFFRGKARNAKKENRNQAKPRDTSSFGTSLFSKLCAENPGSNVLFSPLSVYQALALVKDGATMRSKTALELRKVLGPKTICDGFLLLQQQSNETKDKAGDVILSMATSIWSDGLKPEYIAAAQESQNADSFPMPKNYSEVDTWIKKKTKGMIKEVMGDEAPDPLTVALLVNAVYFKGAWRYEFDPKDTIDGGTFTLIDNITEVDAQYMTAKRERVEVIQKSQALGGADVLILDYGKADTEAEFSAMFILPAESGEDSMNDTISRLGNQPMSDLLEKASSTEVKMRIPRFRLEFGPKSLKSSLQKMGIEAAFNQSSYEQFNRMSVDPLLYVDDVQHGACMEVSEEGTEAAASTVVVMMTRSRPRGVLELFFNRPFLVNIIHRPTGISIFMGKVENAEVFSS